MGVRPLLFAALLALQGCMAVIGPYQDPEGYTLAEIAPEGVIERVVLAAIPRVTQPLLWHVSNSAAVATALEERGVPTRVSQDQRPGIGPQEVALQLVLVPEELWGPFSPTGANEVVQLLLTAFTLSVYGNLIPFAVPPRGGGRFVVHLRLSDARWQTLALSKQAFSAYYRHLWWWSWNGWDQETQDLCAQNLLAAVCDEIARVLRPHLALDDEKEDE